MLPEPYLGLIVGLILAIAPVYLSHYFIKKRITQQQEREHYEKMISEVYSPFFFILSDMKSELSFLCGRLSFCLEEGIETSSIQEKLLRGIQRFSIEKKLSTEIIRLLKSKYGLLKPRELRLDLFKFSSSFESFESGLPIALSKSKIEDEKKSESEWKLKEGIKIASKLFAISNHFAVVLEKVFSQKEIDFKNFKYKKILTKDMMETLRFHMSSDYEKISKKAEKILYDAKKDILENL